MQALIRQRNSNSEIKPPDWTKAFGNHHPLEVDLGCGRGNYALERASMRPGTNVVAIDTRLKWIRAIRQTAFDRGLRNIRAIRCDATQDLSLLFDNESVTGFTIFHPDPWWKKRHRKRRLVQPPWVDFIARLLVPGGWIFVQTDVPDMFAQIQTVFETSNLFEPIDPDAFAEHEMRGACSHRAKKCKELRIPVKRLAVKRIEKLPLENQ